METFTPLGVGHTDHRDVGDPRMLREHVLDLGGIDVLATRDDHVLHTIVEIQEAILVAVARVTGLEPTVVGHGGTRCLLVPPVALHVLR